VFAQSPTEGTKVEEGTVVTIDVSTGRPEVTVPSVINESLADAVAELTSAGLDAKVVEVDSDRTPGTVTGQQPSAGTVVVEGTQVRINVSRGPRPVPVPNVIGFPYDQAAAELQRAGFAVARVEVDSDLSEGIVVGQDPDGNSTSAEGSTVTLSVSRGPVTTAVPDVTNQEVSIARTTLEAAGFRVRTVLEDTTDPAQDGFVIAQDPIGGSQEEESSTVTLVVGRFTGFDTETGETDTGDTTTTP
jgi:serine/threonine-protein kinase